MRKVVSNTTPLISFIKLSRLDILEKIYKKIFIPEAVYREIEEGKDKYYLDLSKFNWIKIVKIKNKQILNELKPILDNGEAEAIALAMDISADLLIIDEKLGRKIAEKYNLKITGTIGILLKAKKLGIIKEIKPLIEELMEKGNYYDKTFIELVLKQAGEK